jgi:hypothetical protein
MVRIKREKVARGGTEKGKGGRERKREGREGGGKGESNGRLGKRRELKNGKGKEN